jgi:hypothetical protein
MSVPTSKIGSFAIPLSAKKEQAKKSPSTQDLIKEISIVNINPFKDDIVQLPNLN